VTKKYVYTKKTGRPTKYKPEYCEEIIRYFTVPHFKLQKTARAEKFNKEGKANYKRVETKEVAEPIRFFSQFAAKIGVEHAAMLDWVKQHPEFSKAYTRAKELQFEMMVSNGLKGLYQPHFTMLAMKNMHNWIEKTEHGLTDETYEKMKGISLDQLQLRFQAVIGHEPGSAGRRSLPDPKASGDPQANKPA
jgi:hypothetical protein